MQVRDFAEWDNSYLITTFPQEMDVLTMHGEADLVSIHVAASPLNEIRSLRVSSANT